ncbi:hypothetical protein FDECE_10617 [Fusarium decemcellulare]|nr:hypothetical protein FDECE_10617 [Fusarium decemcellulare]
MTSTMSKEDIVTSFQTFLDYQNAANWDDIQKCIQPSVHLENSPVQRDAFIAQLRFGVERRQKQSELANYVVDLGSQAIAAEVINSENEPGHQGTAGKTLEYREIAFAWFADGRLSKFKSLRDSHAQPPESTLRQITPESQTPASLDLKAHYQDYISTINAGTMGLHHEKFLQSAMKHNNRAGQVSDFMNWMSSTRQAIQSLHYDIKDLLVDSQSGQIAACVEITGLPVETWLGMEPNGKSIRFQEHAMYWLDKGRIKSLLTVLDLDSARKQLT